VLNWQRSWAWPSLCAFFVVVVGICLVRPQLEELLDANRAALIASRALISDASLLQKPSVLDDGARESCNLNWLHSLEAKGQTGAQSRYLERLIQCSGRRLLLVARLLPGEQHLAEVAVLHHPESSESWLWLARSRGKVAPSATVEYYRRALLLDPRNGLAWRELGDLIATSNPNAAMEAYLQSCRNGDPGYNGCWLAGGLAERQGLPQSAISYYRESQWPPALERAALLERQLSTSRSN
jgi:hypothetical protein